MYKINKSINELYKKAEKQKTKEMRINTKKQVQPRTPVMNQGRVNY